LCRPSWEPPHSTLPSKDIWGDPITPARDDSRSNAVPSTSHRTASRRSHPNLDMTTSGQTPQYHGSGVVFSVKEPSNLDSRIHELKRPPERVRRTPTLHDTLKKAVLFHIHCLQGADRVHPSFCFSPVGWSLLLIESKLCPAEALDPHPTREQSNGCAEP